MDINEARIKQLRRALILIASEGCWGDDLEIVCSEIENEYFTTAMYCDACYAQHSLNTDDHWCDGEGIPRTIDK